MQKGRSRSFLRMQLRRFSLRVPGRAVVWSVALLLVALYLLQVFLCRGMEDGHNWHNYFYHVLLYPQSLQPESGALPRVWKLATYLLVHTSPVVLGAVLLVLLTVGHSLLNAIGTRSFAALVLMCGVGSGIVHLALAGPGSLKLATSGAAAPAFGLLVVYGLLLGEKPYAFGVSGRAICIVLGAALLLVCLLFGRTYNFDFQVTYLAHLAGLGIGIFYYKMTPSLRDRPGVWFVNLDEMDLRTDEEVRREVDRLLDKISERGLGTLTEEERGFLDDASARFRRMVGNEDV